MIRPARFGIVLARHPMATTYQSEFYATRHRRTVAASNRVLDALLPCLPPVRSCLDVGCGVGTWLSTLRERGVEDVLGLDGPWVETSLLEIPADRFRVTPLDRPWSAGRRFDLAMSLEVAEHLPAESADTFVRCLTESADFILFSAAIPGQGGTNHVNEQPASYWVRKFAAAGYAMKDIIRRQIWDAETVPAWYRQNCLVFVREDRAGEVLGNESEGPVDLVHPETFRAHLKYFRGPKGLVRVAGRMAIETFGLRT
jgi:cyclopropane fatty-acyl-phospholipid synthase-like methyltransferase